ncbi:FHA domain-containing protein [Larkinella arboricola]|uniref:FHA domain-containing protein n=1 Tax=Larkinella arboricola TaxID=643671 RepID=A0A327X8M7_LARAB|nr:FHA domain-containing protein [Larkinella arboricola]RAJ99986.1 FHA domain-containing protein [Larkinella arboricola]
MADQPTGWLSKLSNFLVPASRPQIPVDTKATNTQILNELVASFEESIPRESVGSSMLFNAHFLIILHPDVYEERENAFPVIVNEAVNTFHTIIKSQKEQFKHIAPVASSWYFKFGGGREFGGETVNPEDVKVVGALTGILPGNNPVQSQESVKVTRRVKQTNRYEKMDVDPHTFQHIDFREPGAFVVKFAFEPVAPPAKPAPAASANSRNAPDVPRSINTHAGLAQIDYYIAELNKEAVYQMRDREIVVARKEIDNQHFPNYLLVESAYVSNPHARIRYNDTLQAFQIASFSRNETRVNEQLIPRSEPANPQWHTLPDKAQILLNSMVTLHFQSRL